MSTACWTTRLCAAEDHEAVFNLVHAVYPNKNIDAIRAYWQWRYLGSAGFRADVLMAEQDGRSIGIQPVAVFDYQRGDERCKGAMYTGVLTHPEHRRRGVFRSLVQAANEHAVRCKAAFSMTLPNDSSLTWFVRSGEWRHPGLIPLYVKVVNGASMLRSKLGGPAARAVGWVPQMFFRSSRTSRSAAGITMEPAESVPDELDAVADTFARDCGTLMLRRTAAYLNWRFRSPFAEYRILLARRSGSLVGVIATSKQRRGGVDIGMVIDLVARGGLPVLRELLRGAEADLVSQGFGLITCQATTPAVRQALDLEGYRCPKPSWLPKKFHFVYRPTGAAASFRVPRALADWHLTFSDSDNA